MPPKLEQSVSFASLSNYLGTITDHTGRIIANYVVSLDAFHRLQKSQLLHACTVLNSGTLSTQGANNVALIQGARVMEFRPAQSDYRILGAELTGSNPTIYYFHAVTRHNTLRGAVSSIPTEISRPGSLLEVISTASAQAAMAERARVAAELSITATRVKDRIASARKPWRIKIKSYIGDIAAGNYKFNAAIAPSPIPAVRATIPIVAYSVAQPKAKVVPMLISISYNPITIGTTGALPFKRFIKDLDSPHIQLVAQSAKQLGRGALSQLITLRNMQAIFHHPELVMYVADRVLIEGESKEFVMKSIPYVSLAVGLLLTMAEHRLITGRIALPVTTALIGHSASIAASTAFSSYVAHGNQILPLALVAIITWISVYNSADPGVSRIEAAMYAARHTTYSFLATSFIRGSVALLDYTFPVQPIYGLSLSWWPLSFSGLLKVGCLSSALTVGLWFTFGAHLTIPIYFLISLTTVELISLPFHPAVLSKWSLSALINSKKPEAATALAQKFANGDGVPRDTELAAALFSLNQVDQSAYALSAAGKMYNSMSTEELYSLSNSGNLNARLKLIYRENKPGSWDEFASLITNYDGGHKATSSNPVLLYVQGEAWYWGAKGVPKDYQHSSAALRQFVAVVNGARHTPKGQESEFQNLLYKALLTLGKIYIGGGHGIQRDGLKAKGYLEAIPSDSQFAPEAYGMLGIVYKETLHNWTRAVAYFSQNLQSTTSNSKLCIMYIKGGYGLQADLSVAAHYCTKAVETGNYQSIINLWCIYRLEYPRDGSYLDTIQKATDNLSIFYSTAWAAKIAIAREDIATGCAQAKIFRAYSNSEPPGDVKASVLIDELNNLYAAHCVGETEE